jgi:hypothetical protein
MERQTNMTELIVAFRNFRNAPENGWHLIFFFSWREDRNLIT